jgi:hypothetical protein
VVSIAARNATVRSAMTSLGIADARRHVGEADLGDLGRVDVDVHWPFRVQGDSRSAAR